MRSIKTTTALIIFYIFITTLAHAKIAEEYLNSGYDKVEQKDYREAIQDYNKAIELNPDYAKAYVNRGLAKANLQDYRGAIQDFTKAIELDPDLDKTYHN